MDEYLSIKIEKKEDGTIQMYDPYLIAQIWEKLSRFLRKLESRDSKYGQSDCKIKERTYYICRLTGDLGFQNASRSGT